MKVGDLVIHIYHINYGSKPALVLALSTDTYITTDGTNKPYRCKIRAPGFDHLQALDYLTRGHLLPDLSAVLGSLDLVFGEVDR